MCRQTAKRKKEILRTARADAMHALRTAAQCVAAILMRLWQRAIAPSSGLLAADAPLVTSLPRPANLAPKSSEENA